jgi:hypothetical protein
MIFSTGEKLRSPHGKVGAIPGKDLAHATSPRGPVKANSAWRRKTILRALSLFAASAIIAGVVSTSGIVRDLGSFRASVLTGSAGGAYHVLATRLAERAKRDGKRLDVVATEGSIQNVSRLIAGRGACVDKFAFIQDGTLCRPMLVSNCWVVCLSRSHCFYWGRAIIPSPVLPICAALPLG